jgi:hypothetical membrane protein
MNRASASDRSETKPQSENRLAGVLLCLSGVGFFIFNHVAESIYPSYSVRKNYLSDLGATGQPTTFLWDGMLFLTGILWLLGAYFFLRRSGRRKLTLALYLLAPVGQIVVSLFPENTILAVHTIGALVTFLFGGLSAVYAYRLTRSPFGYFSLVLGAIALVSLLLFVSGRFLGLGVGGMERMIVYPIDIWLIVLGGYLMAASPDH